MKKLYTFTPYMKSLTFAAVVVAGLVGCTTAIQEEDTIVKEDEVASVRLTVDEGATIGSAIHSMVLAGSSYPGVVTNVGHISDSEGTYAISPYDGKRSFYFVTNLTATDQTTVKNAVGVDFNDVVLNTADYIPTPSTTAQMPMIGMLVDYTWDMVKKLASTPSKLTRLFAVVDYTIQFPSSAYTLVDVKVKNIPAKFALATTLDDYDLTGNGYISYNLNTEATGKFFLPENKVSDPVFFDADDNGMTYMEVQYKDPATGDQVHTAKFRIAEYTSKGFAQYGNVKRNNIYTFTIAITEKTKANVTQFLN